MAMDGTDFAVLGPLNEGSKTPAQLGCEVISHQPRSDRPVVLRWLPQSLLENRQLIHHFQQQTALAAQLRHPAILQTHGLISFEQGWARITNFGNGEPIASLLSHSPKVAPALASRMVVDVAEAVHYAHQKGAELADGQPLIHGGIRPDTVLISFDGTVLVTGFGANLFAPKTISSFLAPEQVVSGRYAASIASDVYALGALMYTLVTGSEPFWGAEDLYQSIVERTPENTESHALSRDLVALACTAMAKRGPERPESPLAFAEAISSIVQSHQQSIAAPAALSRWANTIFPPTCSIRTHRARILEIANNPQFAEALRFEAMAETEALSNPSAEGSSHLPTALPSSQEATPQPPFENSSSLPTVLPTPREPTPAPSPPSAPSKSPEKGVEEGTATVTEPRARYDSGLRIASSRSSAQRPALRLHTPDPTQARNHQNTPRSKSHGGPSSGTSPSNSRRDSSGSTRISDIREPAYLASLASKKLPSTAFIHSSLSESPLPSPREVSGIIPATNPSNEPPAVPIADPRETSSSLPPVYPPSPPLDSPNSVLLRNQPVKNVSSRKASAKTSNQELSSSIIRLRQTMGDGSRSTLFIVALIVFVLLGVIISPTLQPISDGIAIHRKTLDRRLIQDMFAKSATTSNVATRNTVIDGEPPGSTTNQRHPESPRTTGLLRIVTEPSVDVFINGKNIGRTPLLERDIQTGIKQIRLTDRKTRINTYRKVTIYKDRETIIDEVFRTSLLKVLAPKGANILLNGHPLAKAPMSSPAQVYEGSYLLTVTYKGMKWSKWLNILPDREIHFSVGVKS